MRPGATVRFWPLLAGGLLLVAEPNWGTALQAQAGAFPTLSCVTRAADAAVARIPLIRFTGALPPGDTLTLRVEWLPPPTGENPQRVVIEARRAEARTECASRRRLVVELEGPWRSDAVVLRVFGSPAFELQVGPNGRALRVPRPAPGTGRRPLTHCVLIGAEGGPALRCDQSQ
jgi:hypothetical protein